MNCSNLSYLNTSMLEKNDQSKLKNTKSLRQILHNDIDFYLHSQKVFEAINSLRENSWNYIEKLESLKLLALVDNSGAYIKINKYQLRCTIYDIEELKEFLIKIHNNQKCDTIMWNENIQKVGLDILQNLSNTDYLILKKELDQRLSLALNYKCEFVDFILYDYLDPVFSIFVILIENPDLREKLLCNNLQFGAAACRSFKEVASVLLIILVNKKNDIVIEDKYLDMNIKINDDGDIKENNYKDGIY